MINTIARILRKRPTEAERFLWRRLRGRQVHGFKFRRQFPIGEFVLDFVCLERKLAVELDGGQHAFQVEYDADRSTWLQEQGFQVLRFWNSQVFRETDAVLRDIATAVLSNGNPPPQPSPARGEGE